MRDLRILVLAREPDVYIEPVRVRFSDAIVSVCREYQLLADALAQHRPNVVLASKIGLPFPRQVLFDCPSLEWVQTVSAGVDHLLPIDPRVKVTSASGIHDEVLADYVIGAVLMWNLHAPQFFRQQLARMWKSEELIRLGNCNRGGAGKRTGRRPRARALRKVGV